MSKNRNEKPDTCAPGLLLRFGTPKGMGSEIFLKLTWLWLWKFESSKFGIRMVLFEFKRKRHSLSSKELSSIAYLCMMAMFSEPEVIAAIIALIGGILLFVLNHFYGEHNKQFEHDKSIFLRIKNETFLSSRDLAFLREHNFVYSFPMSQTRGLRHFADVVLNDVSFTFIDKGSEEKKMKLFQALRVMNAKIVSETFPAERNSEELYIGVPREWRQTDPDRFDKVVLELNDLSQKTLIACEDFLEYGRRDFKV